jgi:hypothetical protein
MIIYNFDIVWLVLDGWAQDYDPTGENENGIGKIELPGKRFNENRGDHSFLIESSGFHFRFWANIKIVN